MMQKPILFLAVVGTGLAAFAAYPKISNVRLVQDPGRVVTVTYDLADADAVVTADVLTNGVSIGEVNFTNLTGDVNCRVAAGTDRVLRWKPWESWPDQRLDAGTLKVRLRAWNVADPPDYHVTDLATGAIRYYVSTNAFPGGFWDPQYRTTKLVMKKISAAMKPFIMGAPSYEIGWADRQKQHKALLTNDFYIGVFELTQAQLVNIDGRNRYYSTATYKWTQTNKFANVACAATRPADNLLWRTLRGDSLGYRYPTDFQVDAWSILGRLRAKSGLMIDLPTEAMWEFACRGGSESQCFNTDLGLTINDVSRNRSNGGCSDASGGAWPFDVAADKGTARVGSYAPNAYGLYDMYGNVNEICLDRYAALTDGRTAVDPLGDRSSGTHVARGGNCMSEAKWLTSAMRMGPDIKGMTSPNPSDLYGARLALRLP